MINHGVGLRVETTRVNGDESNGHAESEHGNNVVNGEANDEQMSGDTLEPQVGSEDVSATREAQESEQQPPESIAVDATALLLLPLLIEDLETRFPGSQQKEELCKVIPDAAKEITGSEEAEVDDTQGL